jgi:hypothetical protein
MVQSDMHRKCKHQRFGTGTFSVSSANWSSHQRLEFLWVLMHDSGDIFSPRITGVTRLAWLALARMSSTKLQFGSREENHRRSKYKKGTVSNPIRISALYSIGRTIFPGTAMQWKDCYVAESQTMASHHHQNRGSCRPLRGSLMWWQISTFCNEGEPLTPAAWSKSGNCVFCRWRRGICHGLTLLQRYPRIYLPPASRSVVGPCILIPRSNAASLSLLFLRRSGSNQVP